MDYAAIFEAFPHYCVLHHFVIIMSINTYIRIFLLCELHGEVKHSFYFPAARDTVDGSVRVIVKPRSLIYYLVCRVDAGT